MNFNEILKTQMILSMANSINPLTNILALNIFDIGTKTFPTWSNWVRNFCFVRQSKSNVSASITCERGTVVNNKSTAYLTRMDAVIHHVTGLPSMKNLLSVSQHDYLPHHFDAIELENDVYFELQDMKVNDGQLEVAKFRLYSYHHDVQYLQSFIENCSLSYERHMANKLGNHKYFFDQIVQSKVRGTIQNPLPNTHLVYTKTKFTTNRTFKNVFFEDRNYVQGRTQFFLENREWYDKKGIPYTLGFMFYGPPGTGKTSTVKAIANEGKRHIINVQLSEIKTKQQLQHLFFNDEITVVNGTITEKFIIPVSERLYVIEDIDAMGDLVLRREWKKPEPVKPKNEEDAWLDRQKEAEKETIDLSFLLNLLDGTLEANGRILIITTNFPERIDKALIRPGRIDMIVHFKKCSSSVLQDMVNSFYDKQIEIPDLEKLDYKWSPAEVNQILFRHFEHPEDSIKELFENGFEEFNETNIVA